MTRASDDEQIVFTSDRGKCARVAVVMPLFNYAHLVTASLDSVATQTTESVELIVVNDASTDTSRSVALEWLKRHSARFYRTVLLSCDVNRGLAASRNAGVRCARAPLFFPLDADNLCPAAR